MCFINSTSQMHNINFSGCLFACFFAYSTQLLSFWRLPSPLRRDFHAEFVYRRRSRWQTLECWLVFSPASPSTFGRRLSWIPPHHGKFYKRRHTPQNLFEQSPPSDPRRVHGRTLNKQQNIMRRFHRFRRSSSAAALSLFVLYCWPSLEFLG